ncbi:MAG: helix-turn-helix domain-containing protein [Alphaproteobacteria bacterium]
MSSVSVKLKEKLDACGATVYWLSKQSGIPQSTLKNVYYGRSEKPSLDLLKTISFYLNCAPEDLLSEADPRRAALQATPQVSQSVNHLSLGLYSDLEKIAGMLGHVFDVALSFSKRAGDNVVKNGVEALFKVNEAVMQDKQDYPYRVMSWPFFDWINNDDLMVASAMHELDPPEDVTKVRLYYTHTRARPRQLIFDPVNIGLPSGEYIVPAAVGIEDDAGSYFGAVSMGFNIDRLKEEIRTTLGDENICFALLDHEKKIVLSSTSFEDNDRLYFSKILKGVSLEQSGTFKNKINFHNSIYTHHIKLKNYSFFVFLGLNW